MQKRSKRSLAAEAAALLPLRPVACAVLASLAEEPRIGIDILEAVNTTVPGRALLGPGTLYRLLKELRQQDLIERVDLAEGSADDRHSPHGITPLGAAVLDAELDRLRRTLLLATSARPAR
jgi:DNA-binding PadR family transcriptional regulator